MTVKQNDNPGIHFPVHIILHPCGWLLTGTQGEGRNPNASLYIKSHVLRGEQVSQRYWKPPLKTQFRESLSCFVFLGVRKFRIFHRCSAGGRIVPESRSGNASGSAESCGNDLRRVERGHSPARVFHQEQRAAWSVGNAGSVPLRAHPSP